jgi:exonuclease SbcC
LSRQLGSLEADTKAGMSLISAASVAGRQLDELRSRDLRSTTLRATVSDLAERLGIAHFDKDQPFESAFTALQAALDRTELSLTDLLSRRQRALPDARTLKALLTKRNRLNANLVQKRNLREQRVTAKNAADERIGTARDLARTARGVRTDIVRRVFNDTLNAVWSDLFVRLAPEEQFVPAFALPASSDRPVEAVLETIYRAGGKGGNPRAMLSAGNLNTAALTLFLALHLSVERRLPWLVIDDPVQSMDEVHIAQFAALLRTLSKSQGCQIILAMHERPLFDYLSLELSPAFSDDRLITIELGQAADGKTTLHYEPLIWQPDPAVAA